jgi:UDP-N-acetylmuramate dehydrogenase
MYNNFSLKKYNTFGIDVFAKTFLSIDNEADLEKLPAELLQNALVLGGGSNILFTQNPENPVLHMNVKGISILEENENFALVCAKAGEKWNDFVMFCVEKNWGGLENLSLIPGSVGAAPVQNIGAYGVEMKDCVIFLKAFDKKTRTFIRLEKEDCQFAYRDSIFKSAEKNRYIITEVCFKLFKKNYRPKTEYAALRQFLNPLTDAIFSIKDVSDAVIAVRMSKLPSPEVLGNGGSFFKNPEITLQQAEELAKIYPDMPQYAGNLVCKIAAGWLIEKAGWKGVREGNVGTYPLQALVIVNYGEANGAEILAFSEKIKDSVFQKFGIRLETEVNFF